MSFTDRLLSRVCEPLPVSERDAHATKIFILDAIGVGYSGTHLEHAGHVRRVAQQFSGDGSAAVFSGGATLSRDGAAMVNGYLIHNQEFDCVHEQAIVHPMGVILSALLAHGSTKRVTGSELLQTVAHACDIAITIGMVSRAPLKFYRQGMAAALGAAGALSRLTGLSPQGIRHAMGICYSQLSGTMQAHAEASPMLPLQMGFNARGVLNAVDFATAGFPGPADFLEGRYGFFNLMEESVAPDGKTHALKTTHRVVELSHKPFPTGRATHAAVDGLLKLQRSNGLDASDVAAVQVSAPPLVVQLGGRRATTGMRPNYARLCLPYVAAVAMLRDTVDSTDFLDQALNDSVRLELAERVEVSLDDNPDRNALAPVTVEIRLKNGQTYGTEVAAILGHPDNPLSEDQYLEKFRRACGTAAKPLTAQRVEQLIGQIMDLELLDDATALLV